MIRTDLIVRRPDPMANYVIVSGRTRVAQLWLGKHCEGGLTGDGLMVDQRMISDIIDGFKKACADDEVFLRCASHRACERLFRTLGRKPQAFYRFDPPIAGKGVYLVSRMEAEQIAQKPIKGVTWFRGSTDALRKCW